MRVTFVSTSEHYLTALYGEGGGRIFPRKNLPRDIRYDGLKILLTEHVLVGSETR